VTIDGTDYYLGYLSQQGLGDSGHSGKAAYLFPAALIDTKA